MTYMISRKVQFLTTMVEFVDHWHAQEVCDPVAGFTDPCQSERLARFTRGSARSSKTKFSS